MPDDHPASEDRAERQVAIRRWGDACFHRVDEVVEEGYILGSVLIRQDEVLEVIEVGRDEVCPRRVAELRVPGSGQNG